MVNDIENSFFVKSVFKILFLRCSRPKMFCFVEENFVIEGLSHKYSRISFCS